MSNASIQKWRGTLLCVLALGSTAALAEPDTFFLGSGRNGSYTAPAANVTLNSYGRVSAPLAPGDTVVSVDSVRCPRAPCFEAGDLVMVLRTTGLTPVPPLQTPPAPIDLSGSEVGLWELARLASVSETTLTLSRPLVHAYAAEVTQIIRVPEYTDVTIPAGTSIVASAWNGLTGGVVAFLAQGRVTLDGELSASNAGFRGGVFVNDTSGRLGCTGVDEAAPSGARKGEGIASTHYGPTSTGRGHVTHGGGGGVCSKSGGGGGGHGGEGGQGGDSVDGTRAVGGMGGVALLYSQLDRLTLGGGGGAGHGSLGTGNAGGQGGGAIFLRAGELTGTGLLTAYGASGGFTNSDAGSGGGAGGSIYLRLAGSASCGGIDVSGGTGGSSNASKVGPGGGGGGGRVLFQAADGSCSPDLTSVIGAAPGAQKLSTAPGGVAYGAQPGDPGTLQRLTGGFALPAVPTVSEPADQAFTRERRPLIQGTAEADTQVFISIDGVEVGWTLSNSAGEYVFAPPVDLIDGNHTVEAAAEREGARSASSPASTFTVDTTPPAKPVVFEPAQGVVTRDSTPVITGTAEPGSNVTVLIDGVEYGPVRAEASGDWRYTPTTPLDDGGHTVKAQARDVAGNVSLMSDTRAFQVDTSAPATPSVLAPAEGSSTTNSTPTITGTAEPGSDVTVLINGVEHGPVKADGSGGWRYTPTAPLPEGSNEVHARATDAAGNASGESTTHTFRVDTQAPPAPEVSTTLDGAHVGSTPVITGTAEPGSIVTIIIDGQEVGTTQADASGDWSYTPTTPLSEGPHEVKVRATDEAGNSSPVSEGRAFTVDEPTPDIPSPPVDRAFRGDGLGCAATGGDASLVLLGLGAFAALARRRRRKQGPAGRAPPACTEWADR